MNPINPITQQTQRTPALWLHGLPASQPQYLLLRAMNALSYELSAMPALLNSVNHSTGELSACTPGATNAMNAINPINLYPVKFYAEDELAQPVQLNTKSV